MSKGVVQRGLSAHAAIGLVAGAFLYLVCLTGTLLVFYEEWQRIEQPNAPEMNAISGAAIQRAIETVVASEKGKPRTTHLYVHMPIEALPRTTITTDNQAVHVDAAGRIAGREENGWAEFLLALHYTLNIPSIAGITIVGMLGVMLMALSVTGVIAHPRIFRDAFRLRSRDSGGIALADWHNRLGVWTLPFSIAIALTGAMIGLASVNGYGLATSFYKGDVEAVYAPIFGAEGKPDPATARLPDIASALAQMTRSFPGVAPSYVILHDPGTRGQQVQIVGLHRHRLIFGENYVFDASGRYLGRAGLADGYLGQQVAASAYNLHFGNYGGLPVKIGYFLMGLAVTIVSATGVSIWLGKRVRRGLDQPRVRALWSGVVWGFPLALTLCLLSRLFVGNDAAFVAIFWAGSAAIVTGAAAFGARADVGRWLRRALGLGVAAAAAGLLSQF